MSPEAGSPEAGSPGAGSQESLRGPPLRIAVLGDFDGQHTRRWLQAFVERGHDVHAISYYRPASELPGVRLHVLSGSSAPSAMGDAASTGSDLRRLLPPSLLRLGHAMRYRRAGLQRVLASIQPDVFHAHYVVEHGFYGAMAGFHPYVVSAWGSDILVESYKPLGERIARWTLGRADLVTANDPAMARRVAELGADGRVSVVHLGLDPLFLRSETASVNLSNGDEAPTVLSDRALEPLYKVDVVILAFELVRRHLPTARLLIANDGSQRARLEALGGELGLGDSVRFLGRLDAVSLRETLARAQVYVSLPASDSFPQSTLEAMAVGAFPVVSDLPSQAGWIEQGVNGLLVPPGSVEAAAEALFRALSEPELRREAVALNRAKAESMGSRERNMLVLERQFYRLAGHPVVDGEAIRELEGQLELVVFAEPVVVR